MVKQESHEKLKYHFCTCRPSVPYCGKQWDAHKRTNKGKTHDKIATEICCIWHKAYVCDIENNEERKNFFLAHEQCKKMEATCETAHAFFASVFTTRHLEARQLTREKREKEEQKGKEEEQKRMQDETVKAVMTISVESGATVIEPMGMIEAASEGRLGQVDLDAELVDGVTDPWEAASVAAGLANISQGYMAQDDMLGFLQSSQPLPTPVQTAMPDRLDTPPPPQPPQPAQTPTIQEPAQGSSSTPQRDHLPCFIPGREMKQRANEDLKGLLAARDKTLESLRSELETRRYRESSLRQREEALERELATVNEAQKVISTRTADLERQEKAVKEQEEKNKETRAKIRSEQEEREEKMKKDMKEEKATMLRVLMTVTRREKEVKEREKKMEDDRVSLLKAQERVKALEEMEERVRAAEEKAEERRVELERLKAAEEKAEERRRELEERIKAAEEKAEEIRLRQERDRFFHIPIMDNRIAGDPYEGRADECSFMENPGCGHMLLSGDNILYCNAHNKKRPLSEEGLIPPSQYARL